jgi:hypothetical protein
MNGLAWYFAGIATPFLAALLYALAADGLRAAAFTWFKASAAWDYARGRKRYWWAQWAYCVARTWWHEMWFATGGETVAITFGTKAGDAVTYKPGRWGKAVRHE